MTLCWKSAKAEAKEAGLRFVLAVAVVGTRCSPNWSVPQRAATEAIRIMK
jgi:hypothetical protein